jgi:glycosyltransferase involved in cell wall biosynthesis
MISVVLATYNEADNIKRCLQAVQDWADEIVVVDGNSQDETAELAQEIGAKVISTSNKANFHINKQMAIDAAQGDLILQLDADEVVTAALAQFIQNLDAQLPRKERQATDSPPVAWYIKRKNLMMGRWLKKGGQYPDPVIRLFIAGQARLPQQDVHEQMEVDGPIATAPGHLLHYANPTFDDYWRKFQTYTSFKAQQLAQSGLNCRPLKALQYLLLKPLLTFSKIFLRHKGFVDGWPGFVFALGSGLHHAVSFLKLCRLKLSQGDNQQQQASTKIKPPTQAKQEPIQVRLDTSPLANAHAIRGVGVYTRFLQQALAKNQRVKLSTKKCSAKCSPKSDLVHYPYFDLFFSTLPWPNNGPKAHPTIVTVHDVIPLRFPHYYRPGLRGRLKFFRQKLALRRCQAVITDSQASKQDIEHYLGIKPDKIYPVPLAANPKLQAQPASVVSQVRRKYDLPSNYILYVGDINYNKNIPSLIQSLVQLPADLHLVLLGKNFRPQPIPEWQRLEQQIKTSDLKSRLTLLPNITGDANQELAAIYSGARAYVQPSLWEGFGLPVLEAMHCQTPVVSSNRGSLPEVSGTHAILVEPQASSIAQGVQTVLEWSAQARQKFVTKAAAHAQQFTWQKTAQQTIDVYQQVITTSN